MSYVVRNIGKAERIACASLSAARPQRYFGADVAHKLCPREQRGRLPSRKISRCKASTRLYVRSAWGDDIQWSPAKIKKLSKAAEGFQTMLLEVGEAAAKKYERAGQYLQVRANKDSPPGFYAIASSPESSQDGTIELLIRMKGEIPDLIVGAGEGADVEASPIGGPGFKVEKAPPSSAQQVLLFATGSGISPVKALIESGALQADERKSVRLFWGTHSPESTPYEKETKEWEAKGVKVINVFSTSGQGYVQDVFEKENEIQDGSSVAVVLCGHKEMAQTLTKQLEDAGVDKEKILLNF